MLEVAFAKIAILLLSGLFIALNLKFMVEALESEESSDRALALGVFVGYLLVALAVLVRVLWDYIRLAGGA